MLVVRAASAAPAFGRRAASTIALKYSKAVYGAALAKSPQALTKVHGELAAVAQTIQSNAEIGSFIINPTLSAKERTAGLGALISQLESSAPKKEPLSDVTKNLLSVLSENGRLGETQGVIEGFNELVAQYRGELSVTVTSASPLPRDVLGRLESSLKQSTAARQAKVVKISNKVNPSILGGLIVDFGDKTIDLSVQSRVTKLNNALQQSV
ncbi:F1 complex, OSCP/delta subunit of ATPase [Pluteus cervinus]|uniref:F1 complex, OSCP/delta subunit of ATPase n=1 Tax=Pluteus cervinus TaxID=181527 RepID=A0ACD3BAT4_9AGAR|nr:F1 complex, OSCP/delta subunit of ATPase [Pluteus cervinus]